MVSSASLRTSPTSARSRVPTADHVLVFTATVAGKKLQGCDLLHFDENGRIDDFTVMVRPLSAAQALAEAMGAQFERIAREAAEQ